MMGKRVGEQTVLIENHVGIASSFAVVGPKEGKGPLGQYFDQVLEDPLCGQNSFEMAEHVIFKSACGQCIEKAGLEKGQVQMMLGGDLLNQIMAASLSARDLGIPFLGLYGACSTMTESLLVGAMLCDGGFANPVLCAAGSHFCTAERQYRFPLEYGCQRTPSAQWTVTGAGAHLLMRDRGEVRIVMGTCGRVIDFGVSDANNMGAAMAPAAADTVWRHLKDTGRSIRDYDQFITGDLGAVGSRLLYDLLGEKGVQLTGEKHTDCGLMVFDKDQDVHAGGSGCGCAATVLSAYVLPKMCTGEWRRVAFMATGALLSTTTSQQGESIPGVAHLVVLERERK